MATTAEASSDSHLGTNTTLSSFFNHIKRVANDMWNAICFICFWLSFVGLSAIVVASTIYFPIDADHFHWFLLAFLIGLFLLKAGYAYGERNNRLEVEHSDSAGQCLKTINACFEKWYQGRGPLAHTMSAEEQANCVKREKKLLLENIRSQRSGWPSEFSRRQNMLCCTFHATLSYFVFRFFLAPPLVRNPWQVQCVLWSVGLMCWSTMYMTGRLTYWAMARGNVAETIRKRCEEPVLDTEKGKASWPTMEWWSDALQPGDTIFKSRKEEETVKFVKTAEKKCEHCGK